MTESEIKQLLDNLDEYKAQAEVLEMNKRALLDEVKVPDEVIDIQRNAAEAIEYQQDAEEKLVRLLRSNMENALNGVQIPQEVREILAKIDSERAAIRSEYENKIAKVQGDTAIYRGRVNAETQEKTRQVYADLAQRKADIEAEFAGKLDDLAANIAKLEREIKDAVKAHGATVKAKHYQAVYVSGRITWKTDRLDSLVYKFQDALKIIRSYVMLTEELSPISEKINDALEIVYDARKEGEPSITLRKI